MACEGFVIAETGAVVRRAAFSRRLHRHDCCRIRHVDSVPSRRLYASANFRMSRTESTTTRRAEKVIDGPFEGHYGQWNLTQGDIDGVTVYRTSLALCAGLASFGIVSYLLGTNFPPKAWDALFFAASGCFGVALQTIHIYLKPMHNFIKGLWAAGLICSGVLAASPLLSSGAMVTEVLQRPELMLAVGWQFVSLTGLFFKEAVCFGRKEALALFALVPILSGGHFLHLLPSQVESGGAVVFSALFMLFCVRKFLQNPRDDLGDKSVFEHLEKGGTLG